MTSLVFYTGLQMRWPFVYGSTNLFNRNPFQFPDKGLLEGFQVWVKLTARP